MTVTFSNAIRLSYHPATVLVNFVRENEYQVKTSSLENGMEGL